MKRLVKPWGRRDLPAPFASPCGDAVGEIWFDTPALLRDILTKYLFTAEQLSVQVHPLAEHCPVGAGKDECWLVTQAAPGARLAIGFRQEVAREDIRSAALDGSIEGMLDWREVQVDDFLYVPSGTVHAIGPGLTLVEVQQNTDVTFRLYDYGRPRELHLDEAMRSVRPGPHPAGLGRKVDPRRSQVLVDGPHYSVVQVAGVPGQEIAPYRGAVQILPLAGHCTIAGEAVAPGQSGWAKELRDIDFTASERCLLVFNPPRSTNQPVLP
ncbi:class I mannose-6-phosphate isomerase [Qipengyuania sp. 1NDH17]|uniref:Class I mannose-6-phosphate isomerase n=1 Tax=Qipengyuania polymorpha TaxID=2867234 RepID=A0ABS7J152_9SPHN|nr:class I mannose-6-phosphate isomerase [Qipengyuania polymorpha]MBX7458295.1 class I mannose-6-phosphate isomerase [Qipengyuania polymorpha]